MALPNALLQERVQDKVGQAGEVIAEERLTDPIVGRHPGDRGEAVRSKLGMRIQIWTARIARLLLNTSS